MIRFVMVGLLACALWAMAVTAMAIVKIPHNTTNLLAVTVLCLSLAYVIAAD